ncbi:hypothetical protein GN956_G26235, partial [Arapaima gigas]
MTHDANLPASAQSFRCATRQPPRKTTQGHAKSHQASNPAWDDSLSPARFPCSAPSPAPSSDTKLPGCPGGGLAGFTLRDTLGQQK